MMRHACFGLILLACPPCAATAGQVAALTYEFHDQAFPHALDCWMVVDGGVLDRGVIALDDVRQFAFPPLWTTGDLLPFVVLIDSAGVPVDVGFAYFEASHADPSGGPAYRLEVEFDAGSFAGVGSITGGGGFGREGSWTVTAQAASVPEPASVGMMGMGIACVLLGLRGSRRSAPTG